MVNNILNAFTLPNDQVTIRIVKEEYFNVMEIIQNNQLIRIRMVGSNVNNFSQMIALYDNIYSSNILTQQNNHQTPPKQLPNPQSNYYQRQSYGPRSSSPYSQTQTQRPPVQAQRMDEISVQEAIDIIKGKKEKREKTVKVKTNEQEMIDFIVSYKGGSEIYIKGELKIFRGLNLFIDFKLFTETLTTLVRQNIVGERHKTSRTGHPYVVYVIPKNITPDKQVQPEIKAEKEQIPQTEKNRPEPAVEPERNNYKLAQEKEQKRAEMESVPILKPASELKSPLTEFLEQLFYSYQDDELTMDLFINEASHEGIPYEISKGFYEKKLDERDNQYSKKKVKVVH